MQWKRVKDTDIYHEMRALSQDKINLYRWIKFICRFVVISLLSIHSVVIAQRVTHTAIAYTSFLATNELLLSLPTDVICTLFLSNTHGHQFISTQIRKRNEKTSSKMMIKPFKRHSAPKIYHHFEYLIRVYRRTKKSSVSIEPSWGNIKINLNSWTAAVNQ